MWWRSRALAASASDTARSFSRFGLGKSAPGPDSRGRRQGAALLFVALVVPAFFFFLVALLVLVLVLVVLIVVVEFLVVVIVGELELDRGVARDTNQRTTFRARQLVADFDVHFVHVDL